MMGVKRLWTLANKREEKEPTVKIATVARPECRLAGLWLGRARPGVLTGGETASQKQAFPRTFRPPSRPDQGR